MSDARVLGALVAVGEALVRGHLPGCVCAQCVAARVAIGGATELVERVRVTRRERVQRRAFVPDPFGAAPELPRGAPELPRGAPVEVEVVAEVAELPPWGRR